MSRKFRIIARRLLPVVLLAAVALPAAIWQLGRMEAARFTVSHHTLRLRRWHAGHRLKVAVLADFHLSREPADRERLRRIVAAANRERPDLVVLLGDFIGRRRDPDGRNASPEAVAAILRELQSRYGVFAVLGNHDHWHDGTAVRRALEAVGIRVLESDYVPVVIDGETLHIVGLPDRMTAADRFRPEAMPDPAVPAVVLAHHPDDFEARRLPYEWMLSGHTHGGQVCIPPFGALVVPSRFGTRYASGWFELDGRKLFVTRGLGTSILPIRLNCPPEIAIIEVAAAGKDAERR